MTTTTTTTTSNNYVVTDACKQNPCHETCDSNCHMCYQSSANALPFQCQGHCVVRNRRCKRSVGMPNGKCWQHMKSSAITQIKHEFVKKKRAKRSTKEKLVDFAKRTASVLQYTDKQKTQESIRRTKR